MTTTTEAPLPALAAVYLIVAPASADLAAAGYRGELFSSAGFTLWDNAWYGGHDLLAYSVLAPALMTFLLLRVSGVSMLDAHLMRTKPGYEEYLRRTSAFVPRPRRA